MDVRCIVFQYPSKHKIAKIRRFEVKHGGDVRGLKSTLKWRHEFDKFQSSNDNDLFDIFYEFQHFYLAPTVMHNKPTDLIHSVMELRLYHNVEGLLIETPKHLKSSISVWKTSSTRARAEYVLYSNSLLHYLKSTQMGYVSLSTIQKSSKHLTVYKFTTSPGFNTWNNIIIRLVPLNKCVEVFGLRKAQEILQHYVSEMRKSKVAHIVHGVRINCTKSVTLTETIFLSYHFSKTKRVYSPSASHSAIGAIVAFDKDWQFFIDGHHTLNVLSIKLKECSLSVNETVAEVHQYYTFYHLNVFRNGPYIMPFSKTEFPIYIPPDPLRMPDTIYYFMVNESESAERCVINQKNIDMRSLMQTFSLRKGLHYISLCKRSFIVKLPTYFYEEEKLNKSLMQICEYYGNAQHPYYDFNLPEMVTWREASSYCAMKNMSLPFFPSESFMLHFINRWYSMKSEYTLYQEVAVYINLTLTQVS